MLKEETCRGLIVDRIIKGLNDVTDDTFFELAYVYYARIDEVEPFRRKLCEKLRNEEDEEVIRELYIEMEETGCLDY